MGTDMKTRKILLTGASGYIGGRLLPLLVEKGESVRCLTRGLSNSNDPGNDNLEFVQGDALNEESLNEALRGVDTAYYLIHSMGASEDFETMDRQAAKNFANACSKQGVKRIIYLGGLGNPDQETLQALAQQAGNRRHSQNFIRQCDRISSVDHYRVRQSVFRNDSNVGRTATDYDLSQVG